MRGVVLALALVACAKPPPPPRPAPPRTPRTVGAWKPRMLPPARVRGELPPGAREQPGGGPRDVLATVCIDSLGKVTDVRVEHAPPGRAAEVTMALGRWYFRPYEVGGERKDACFPVAFELGNEEAAR